MGSQSSIMSPRTIEPVPQKEKDNILLKSKKNMRRYLKIAEINHIKGCLLELQRIKKHRMGSHGSTLNLKTNSLQVNTEISEGEKSTGKQ